MPALFVFLLKVNVALLLFCAGYYLVLRHLTFYTLNRIYLVGAILFATVYPKINLSEFLQHHDQIAKPVQVIAFNWQAPANALAETKHDYWFWAGMVLWTGAALLGIRLLIQFYSLFKLYRRSTAGKIHDHDVRIIDGNAGPFSFWKSIFINPANHDASDLPAILQHEQIHVSELHTLDVLLAELSTVFYWFNPGVWLMKKAVRENIEFITDRKILKNGTDSKQYQYSLVNVSFAAAPQGIVNHFNISTIKKRIIMMNAKRSSKYNLTRYAFLVPAVVALLLVFSISKAALVKKTVPAVKTFSTAGSKAAEKGTVTITATVNKTSAPVIEILKATFVPSKINTAAKDTIRKGGFFLSTSGKSDSLNYVINGVKSTKADLMKLDAKNIESVHVMTGDQASKVIDNLNKGQGAIFIYTRDSEAGKRFKEKADKLLGNQYTVSGTTRSADGDSNQVTLNGVKVAAAAGTTTGMNSDGVIVLGTQSKPAKVQTYNLSASGGSQAIVVQGKPAKTLQLNGSQIYVRSRNDTSHKGQTITFFSDTTSLHKLNGTVMAYTVKPDLRFNTNSWYSTQNDRFSLDHISDKLIIINGNIASEKDLKKVSAFDIDKVVVKTDEETKELYGDKAKKGVVFIVTKKKK
ncbi:MAG: M56 family metallopeptidase [Mucilaginibacter sp.]